MSLFKSNQNQLQQFPIRQKEQPPIQTDQPIVGLRVWNVAIVGGLPKLVSVTMAMEWPYRKPLERDGIKAMGIHAIKPGNEIVQLFNEYSAAVAGEVYLWGEVDEHEQGYLADFAYPKKLFLPSNFDAVKAMQLEDEYGVPCEFRSEFDKPELYPGIALGIFTTSGSLAGLYPQFLQQMSQQNAISNAAIHGSGLMRFGWKP